jgi:nicotinamidase-related amidase
MNKQQKKIKPKKGGSGSMKTALLLIDIQNDYFPNGAIELEGSLKAGRLAGEMLQCFRQWNLPVVHIQHLSLRPGASFLLPGTEGACLHDTVGPLPSEIVIQKHFPNSFRETDLLVRLQKEKVTNLTICGMMTHMCVDATVRAAFDYGFSCTVVHDACATRALSFGGLHIPAASVHGAFLAALGSVYARIASAKDAVREMQMDRT